VLAVLQYFEYFAPPALHRAPAQWKISKPVPSVPSKVSDVLHSYGPARSLDGRLLCTKKNLTEEDIYET
jgi:hypothetical protein